MSATNAQPAPVTIGDLQVGADQPVYVIAEIGINHNGDVEIAKQLIDVAADAGCQRREVPEAHAGDLAPRGQRDRSARDPWGDDDLPRLPLPRRVRREPSTRRSTTYAAAQGLHWFASPWDVPSRRLPRDAGRRRPTRSPRPRSPTIELLARSRDDRQADHPLDRHVDASSRSTRPWRSSAPSELVHAARHVDLPAAARRGEPAHDPDAARALRRARRLLGPRARPADLARRRRARRRAPSSATSRSTARCGAPTRPPRSSRRASSTWCATSASSSRRSATAEARLPRRALADVAPSPRRRLSRLSRRHDASSVAERS